MLSALKHRVTLVVFACISFWQVMPIFELDPMHHNEIQFLDEQGYVYPWFAKPFLDVLKTWDMKDWDVFEFGGGYSTAWFALHCKSVVSVDDNQEWLEAVGRYLHRINCSNVVLKHRTCPNCTIGEDLGNSDFVAAIDEDDKLYDCIVIDGSYARNDCAKHVLRHLKPDGIIILDNANQATIGLDSRSTFELFKDFEHHSFLHTTHPNPAITDWRTDYWVVGEPFKKSNNTQVDSFHVSSQKKLRFFNLDLHISVIADLKEIFADMGHEIVDWSISAHTWVFGREASQVDIVNQASWRDLNQTMCDQFYERYKDYLDQFDGFIVTYSSPFALLFEKCNKPIILVIPTRYEVPFTLSQDKWQWLDRYLQKGVSENRIFIVANNKGDQHYFTSHTGIDCEHIPSLCNYTYSAYTGKKDGFIAKTCALDYLKNQLGKPDFLKNDLLSGKYSWQELYDFKGIIHFPYQISTMSIFEEYSANVPLFFPSKAFLKELATMPFGILSQLSFYPLMNAEVPNIKGDLNNIHDPEVIQFWIDSADFYDIENMPYIEYFDSFEHLEHLLHTVDLQEISKKMKEHNALRKEKVYKDWQRILSKVQERIN